LDGENIDSLQEAINGFDVELGFDNVSVGCDEDNEIDYEIEEDLFAFFDINNDSVSNQSVSNQTVSNQSVSFQSSQSSTAGSVIQIDALIENSVGLPKFIGPVTSSEVFINVMRPRIRSST
jgi:hypothetical protein